MRKIISLLALSGIVVLLMTSCSSVIPRGENSTAADRSGGTSDNAAASSNAAAVSDAAAEIAENPDSSTAGTEGAQGTVNPDTTTSADTAASADTAVQAATVTAAEPVDTGITLESVKKAAIDAGFQPEDIKEDLHQRTGPNPVRGIYINYKDDTLQSQCPVYEFSSSADALGYARMVNSEGYSLCIVNGKLVAMTGSKYGVVMNDKEKATLERLLESSLMTYEEPALPQTSATKDYAGACTRIDAIVKSVDKLVNKSVLIYTKSLPADDPGRNISFVSFSMLSSGDMSFTSTLCEDQAKLDEVVKLWEMYGCTDVKLKHDSANDYILTGKRAGVDDPFNIHCAYLPDKDSLRVMETNGGEKVELFEFVPLGGDKYAFQTLYERGIVGYKDGKITSLTYSVRIRSKDTAYNPDADSIYPGGSGADESWVSKQGEDNYEQFITFDGTKLKISATDFTGSRIKIETGV